MLEVTLCGENEAYETSPLSASIVAKSKVAIRRWIEPCAETTGWCGSAVSATHS
ncbi:hypothetical protein ABWH91_02685 [Phycisphaerales bacterium ac7]